MTTVVDPLGTPSLIYNRSGTAIVSLVGGQTAGSSRLGIGNDANAIPRVSQATVAMVSGTTGPGGTHNILVSLPSAAEIGDVVEVYQDPAATDGCIVFPNVGEAIANGPTSTGTNSGDGTPGGVARSVPATGGIVFRKVSASLWMPVGVV